MPLRTKLTEKLGIRHPILLAPMGTASGGTLAKAVTEGGGLGIIGFGYGNQERINQEFGAAGNARVGCGFITWSLARQPHLLARALDHKPAAVMLSFGDARPFAAAIKDAGAALISQVQTVAQAMEAVDIGTDIVIAQGTEAGGHGATRSRGADFGRRQGEARRSPRRRHRPHARLRHRTEPRLAHPVYRAGAAEFV